MVKSEIDKELKTPKVTNAGCLRQPHKSTYLQWGGQGRACEFRPNCEPPAAGGCVVFGCGVSFLAGSVIFVNGCSAGGCDLGASTEAVSSHPSVSASGLHSSRLAVGRGPWGTRCL